MEDARGRITSHRARATIATQLYNAKEPMTLFELQAWLGHRSPNTTQHYARITPTKLTKGLFGRWLLRAQCARHRGAHRSRCGPDRHRRIRCRVAILRSWAWLLQLQLLRAVPTPHGLRALRLLRSQRL